MATDDRAHTRIQLGDFFLKLQELMLERKLIFQLLLVFDAQIGQMRLSCPNPSVHQSLQRFLFSGKLLVFDSKLFALCYVLLVLSKCVGEFLEFENGPFGNSIMRLSCR